MGRKSNYQIEKEKMAQALRMTVQDEVALSYYDSVISECEGAMGELTPIQLHQVLSCAIAKEIEIRLTQDIQRRGVLVVTHNGKQAIEHENKSITGVRKQQEQIMKLLDSLGMIAKTGKRRSGGGADSAADAEEEDDDFTKF